MGCSSSGVKQEEKKTHNTDKSKTQKEEQSSNTKMTAELPNYGDYANEQLIPGAMASFTGTIADNGTFYGNKLICNQSEMDEFTSSIAKQLITLEESTTKAKPKGSSSSNVSDPFLRGLTINFSQHRLIACKGCRLQSIEVNPSFLRGIVDTETPTHDYKYYAYAVDTTVLEAEFDGGRGHVICDQRPVNYNNRIIEQRPLNYNNRIIEQRPINDNDSRYIGTPSVKNNQNTPPMINTPRLDEGNASKCEMRDDGNEFS